jgi:hypothetical protein
MRRIVMALPPVLAPWSVAAADEPGGLSAARSGRGRDLTATSRRHIYSSGGRLNDERTNRPRREPVTT